ncbi:cystatin-F [Notolabrus celidotus]|uniref:cystatin-F n=1 Tax=Notolabrus celidotus TaxID=1203425 RepID=UPI00149040C2|nr:cystatin-F [Notolabrus celidotus]XP_034537323.1 cystatin-F [Notolabrus celidotus]XP_034537324.1 cystatin-F [Notolabrus celidotus]
MMGQKTLLLLSLLGVLEVTLAFGFYHGRSMPGSPYNINRTDHSLQTVVLVATYSFNNQSNDAFLFKPLAIHRAQRQVVKGLRYTIDFEISRTVCRKRDNTNNDLSKCDFQPEGRLHQTLQCHLEVWVIPWIKKSQTQVFECKP